MKTQPFHRPRAWLAGCLLVATACPGGPDESAPPGQSVGAVETGGDTGTAATTAVSGSTLCAGGGISTDGAHSLILCVGPADVGAGGRATDGAYTLESGALQRISP